MSNKMDGKVSSKVCRPIQYIESSSASDFVGSSDMCLSGLWALIISVYRAVDANESPHISAVPRRFLPSSRYIVREADFYFLL